MDSRESLEDFTWNITRAGVETMTCGDCESWALCTCSEPLEIFSAFMDLEQ
jgi:hypothetical protein